MSYYLLIIGISLLPLVSIFITPSFPHTHDGTVHLARMGAYFKALSDGQIPVRWAGELNYGYGMPLFNFIYQLPYAVASLFLFLGFGLVNSFKIVLSLSYILSGIFMLTFARAFLKDNKKAFLATIFYQFAPFRLVEILIRGSFGEVYAYTFLPLVLLGLTLIMKKAAYKTFFLTAIATALLILSHNSVSLLFFMVILGFVFVFAKTKKLLFLSFTALFFGLFLSAFYWAPAVFEHKYTYGDLFMRSIYLSHFPPLKNLFIPNFTNSQSFQTEGINVQIGFFHVLAIVLSALIIIWRKKLDAQAKKIINYSFILVVVAVFFMQPNAKIVWENISYLRQFQFPWRFLSVIVFATSLLSVSFLRFSFFQKKRAYALLIGFVIISTIYYWRPSLGFDKIDERYYWNFPLNTTYYGETDVIWSAGPAKSYPKERVEIIDGKATVRNLYKKSNFQTFVVESEAESRLVSHTQYFPGWRVYIGNKQVPIEFQDINWRGEITFRVPKGIHQVKILFEETKLRLFADAISVISLLGLLSFPTFRRKRIAI